MQIRLLDQAPQQVDAPLVVVGVPRGQDPLPPAAAALDALAGGAFSRARAAGDFDGREEASVLLYAPGAGAWAGALASSEAGPEAGSTDAAGGSSPDHGNPGPARVLFLGVGDVSRTTPSTLRALAARAVRRAEALGVTHLHLVLPVPAHAAPRRVASGEGTPGRGEAAGSPAARIVAGVQAAAEGLTLAAWDFRELRSNPVGDAPPPRPLVAGASLALDLPQGEAAPDDDALAGAVRLGQAFGAGENFARTLQQRPGNLATPEHLAAAALQLAEDHDLHATILGPREMERERMGALLSVAAGSDQEPRLIALEHRGGAEGDPPLVLVGKGLTFDSGGISIKPASGMEDMKYDMSGGAAVLGAMKAVGMLGLPLNVVGVVPSSENLINGSATKPGDVITARSGTTIEVINTDAEGRLILADALHWAAETFRPRAMVDCATLTGACVVALGHQAAALLGTDEALLEALRAAGDRADEPCWPLPLWEGYRKQLESPVADLKNVGGRPAGSVTAALFLRAFVGDTPWAHLDIAGASYGDPTRPWHRKGGFGVPTRLLLEWVRGHLD
jgi:leucyl aminopeptidase